MLMPVTGYNPSAGFVYGIRIKSIQEMGLDTGTLHLVSSTGSMQRMVLSLSESALDGSFSLVAEHLKLPEIQFFGYGNNGDADSTADFSGEAQRLRLLYNHRIASPFSLKLGIETRHSTTYNREESALWSTLPGEQYNSVWTTGPVAGVRLESASSPAGYIKLDADWQSGNDMTYSTITGQTALFCPIPRINTVFACRAMLKRHIGTETTPFMWQSSLGGSDDLRGYKRNRFSGDWLMLNNIELRHSIFRADSGSSSILHGVGITLFGDAGQVSDSFDTLRWNRYHLSGGVGIRIHLSGDRTVRLDIAKSPEGMGGCVSFGEMF